MTADVVTAGRRDLRGRERGADVAVVEAIGLWAEFASGDGVGPVDLELRAGERVLVLGPSGSGKSTLLRLLHGAVPHAISADVGGAVRIAGRDVADERVAQLADVVGVVAQDPESGVCLPDVDDEVAFPLENLGVASGSIGGAVERALERAGAGALGGRRTAELSGGELQRIALAAAIASEPELLLLDEPTSMLDADGVDAVREAIDRARHHTGAACVLVEHRLDELAGDRGLAGLPERWLVVGRDGRIRHDVAARDVRADVLRELVAEGCWLPLDLELRALLGHDRGETASGRREAVDESPSGVGLLQHGREALDEPRIAMRLLELGTATDRPLSTAGADGPPRANSASGVAESSLRDPHRVGQPFASSCSSSSTRSSGAGNTGSCRNDSDDGDRDRRSTSSAAISLRATGVTLARGPRRNRIPVLAGIDIELRTGELVAVVGANGTGKSTLLTCLAGLVRPDAGRVEGPRAGMVFQHPEHQFAATTVRAELAHGLPHGRETDARVEAQLRAFGLDGLGDHSPHRLSGGQKRRVSLAAMLLHDRPFLLADEPTFGLDRRAQIEAMRALVAAARRGRGVCLSSHDLRAVAAYADRVLVLGAGGLLADTTPMGLLRDGDLLAAARLRPPRLLTWLAERTDDEEATPRILRRLDDLALDATRAAIPPRDARVDSAANAAVRA